MECKKTTFLDPLRLEVKKNSQKGVGWGPKSLIIIIIKLN